ncbi:MAG: transcriptional repressor LexA [Pyrinomonadaceae bacterium]
MPNYRPRDPIWFRRGNYLQYAAMQPRTRRQKDVLDIITRYIEKNGHLPSYQTIARHMGVNSRSGIARHVRSLEAQGLIRRRVADGPFKLELCVAEAQESRLCVVEWLEPGATQGAEDWEREAFAVPRFLLGLYADSDVFAFRVTDDGMSDRNIVEGDVAIIERRTFAREGSTIVANAAGHGTLLRRYYRNGSQIELHAANDAYEMLSLSADAVTVTGVFRALIRPA